MIDDDQNLPTSRWVTEGLARAFGVCIALRDDGYDIPEEEVMKRITENTNHDVEYHEENLKIATASLQKMMKHSREDWLSSWQSAIGSINKANKDSQERAVKLDLRHSAVKVDLEKLRDETTDVSTKRLAEFGLEQLKLVESETKPYTQSLPTSTEYKTNELARAKRDIEYHTEYLEKAKTRRDEAIQTYTNIRREVKRILD